MVAGVPRPKALQFDQRHVLSGFVHPQDLVEAQGLRPIRGAGALLQNLKEV